MQILFKLQVGGFLNSNCEDDILKKSANKIKETGKAVMIMK